MLEQTQKSGIPSGIKARALSWLSAVGKIPKRGLWPYAPDPVQPGMLNIGVPAASAPIILAGNSRHALQRLQRALALTSGQVLVIDSGGLDLYPAAAVNKLALPDILAAVHKSPPAVENIEDTEDAETDADNALSQETALQRAFLAYPIWEIFGAEALLDSGIEPGPAVPEDLPAFLARDGDLTAQMKIPRQPLRERISLVLAHTGLFILLLALPLAIVSAVALAVGLLIVLAAALDIIFLIPFIRKHPRWSQSWLPLVVTVLLLAGGTGMAAAVRGLEMGTTAALALAAAVTGSWLAWLCARMDVV